MEMLNFGDKRGEGLTIGYFRGTTFEKVALAIKHSGETYLLKIFKTSLLEHTKQKE